MSVGRDALCHFVEGISHRDWLLYPGKVAGVGDDTPYHVSGVKAVGLPQRLRDDAVGRAANQEA